MAGNKSAFAGFLLGVILTLILAGGVGYYVFERVQRAISPETTRQTAEEQLSRVAGQPVSVGQAQADLIENLLSLDKVRIGSATDAFLEVDRIELFAEGGVQGLRSGRFSQAVLTHPVVALEQRAGRWNIEGFLLSLLEGRRLAAGEPGDSTSALPAVPGTSLSLLSLKITDLELEVELADAVSFTGFSAEEVQLTRNDPGAPWNLAVRGAQVQVNTVTGDMPLLDAFEQVHALFTSRTGEVSAPQEQGAPAALAEVNLEDISLEWAQPSQILSFEGLSFRAEDFLHLIRAQTGSLEKKKSLFDA